MAELPELIHERVKVLSAEGDAFADAGNWDAAIGRFHQAFELLPEPRLEWDAALWLLAAVGDVHFQAGNYLLAREPLMMAMKVDGATGNPFLRLRLGQVLYELGERAEATSWLAGAYLSEGLALFENENPKYLAFVKPQLQPPPEGWPDGW
jgi:tetratricopeptide (TPR) repeat protein